MNNFSLFVCARVRIVPDNYCFKLRDSVKLCKTFKRPEHSHAEGYTANIIVRVSLLRCVTDV
jgi:hypothetical protein